MMNSLKYIALLLTGIGTLSMSAQLFDAEKFKRLSVEEIQQWSRILSEQLSGPCISVRYTILSFRDQVSVIPEDAEAGESRMFQSGSWGKALRSETFRSQDLTLSVDHSNQTIYVSRTSETKVKDPVVAWSNILSESADVSKVSNTQGTIIRIKYKYNPDVSASEIWLSPENRLQRSVIFLNRKVEIETPNGVKVYQPRMEVKFDRIEAVNDCDESRFGLSSVIKQNKSGSIEPTGDYKGYKIVDTRPTIKK